MPVNIFWFRRDLRLYDNHGLWEALNSGRKVIPLFIFDDNILRKLKKDDQRVPYIHNQITKINAILRKSGSFLIVRKGNPSEIFQQLLAEHDIEAVFTNRDYEPYAVERDTAVAGILHQHGSRMLTFSDQLIFEPGEVIKPDGSPYTVYTPFSKKWQEQLRTIGFTPYPSEHLFEHFLNAGESSTDIIKKPDTGTEQIAGLPSLEEIGFQSPAHSFPECSIHQEKVIDYAASRDIPSLDSTTRIGLCLRFGTLSIRECVALAIKHSNVWLNELIWREFFMHILAHFPQVVNNSFRKQYDNIKWLNDEVMFKRWCEGKTGYPLVDAGMRELKATGFMHNRVRMVTASFLVKHLLTDWRWGEAWFAEHLLDFELSSNNGNWQWAAGSGCDAAPYFRIFNPQRQQERFDSEFRYIRKWVPEFGTNDYPEPVIDHDFARRRCIAVYSEALR